MAPVRIDLDRNFEERLLGDEQLRGAVTELTEAIADRARELAPDDPDTGDPDIRTGIKTEADVDEGVMTGRVNATNWKSHFWEFGHRGPNGRSREKPFLRPAADALGLDVTEGRG